MVHFDSTSLYFRSPTCQRHQWLTWTDLMFLLFSYVCITSYHAPEQSSFLILSSNILSLLLRLNCFLSNVVQKSVIQIFNQELFWWLTLCCDETAHWVKLKDVQQSDRHMFSIVFQILGADWVSRVRGWHSCFMSCQDCYGFIHLRRSPHVAQCVLGRLHPLRPEGDKCCRKQMDGLHWQLL